VRHERAATGPRDFDAPALAKAEFDGWVGYYRREWRKVLAASVRMVRIGFGMSWTKTMRGAWFVLRANQLWAPYPNNDPVGARAYMRRFYVLVVQDGGLSFDPGKAAKLEVEWWRVHRLHQREGAAVENTLAQALVELYSYVYGVAAEAVQDAAMHRVIAMRHSDAWVQAGCKLDDPLLSDELGELERSYTALLAAVRR
jgi:hypothetical protein